MNYKISIIVPIYNGERYIEKCAKSLLNQELKQLEIIFINDGSNDNSKLILDKLSKEYSNIKVLHQDNKGPGAARNLGIKIARGKYIGFVDVDDYPKEDMYLKLYSLAEKYDLDMAVCGFEVRDSNDKVKDIALPNYSKEIYIDRNDIRANILTRIIHNGPEILASQWNKIYKKELLDKYNIRVIEDRRFGEDWLFNQLVLGKINKIGFIEEPLYRYVRSNSESLASSYLKNSFELFTTSKKFREDRMKEWRLDTKEYIYIDNDNFCKLIYDRVIVNELKKENYITIKEKYINIKNYIQSEIVQNAARNSNKNLYSKLYIQKKINIVFVRAYFDCNIRPYCSKLKRVIKNIKLRTTLNRF